uniref:Uncharacterized protein n=1 Tax=Amphimedon queenslandica TaxID=400682 RepID=A0A1X7UPV0_AMPQE
MCREMCNTKEDKMRHIKGEREGGRQRERKGNIVKLS